MTVLWGFAWFVLVYAIVSSWVYLDATARGSSAAALWAALFLPSGLVALYYLGSYRGRHDRVRPRTRRERVIAVLALAAVLSLLPPAFVAPPDPVTQTVYWIASFVPAVPVSYVVYGRLIDDE